MAGKGKDKEINNLARRLEQSEAYCAMYQESNRTALLYLKENPPPTVTVPYQRALAITSRVIEENIGLSFLAGAVQLREALAMYATDDNWEFIEPDIAAGEESIMSQWKGPELGPTLAKQILSNNGVGSYIAGQIIDMSFDVKTDVPETKPAGTVCIDEPLFDLMQDIVCAARILCLNTGSGRIPDKKHVEILRNTLINFDSFGLLSECAIEDDCSLCLEEMVESDGMDGFDPNEDED